MLADRAECVIGVDTHRDQHAVVVVDATSGRVVDQLVVPAGRLGMCRLWRSLIGVLVVACGRLRALAPMALGCAGSWSSVVSGWWRWSGPSGGVVMGG
jgi:hypothetical protein